MEQTDITETDHPGFMRIALNEAEKSRDLDEIPVGAVIVSEGEVISAAGNRNRIENNPVRHAEITAIEEACRVLGNERLTGCDMYVTKEPCCMCAGAIVHARIRRVFIGARDIKYGACGTVLNVCGNVLLNHVPEIHFGFLQQETADIIKRFFQEKRSKNR